MHDPKVWIIVDTFMPVRSVQFITSVAEVESLPKADQPEVALAGRSNAGKSSFINALAQKSVAFVSQKPGKTDLLNFYGIGSHYKLVDMPGYGYAAQSGSRVRQWQPLIEGYLTHRENLRGVILFIDVRRDWTDDEQQIFEFCREQELPIVVALTKLDQLNQAHRAAQLKRFRTNLKSAEVFPLSSHSGEGVAELEKYIFINWIQK